MCWGLLENAFPAAFFTPCSLHIGCIYMALYLSGLSIKYQRPTSCPRLFLSTNSSAIDYQITGDGDVSIKTMESFRLSSSLNLGSRDISYNSPMVRQATGQE